VIDPDVVNGATAQHAPSRDELERLLAERTAALEATRRELEAFTFAVSHDLRAPLRTMDGFSRVLLEDCADRLDDENRDHLRRIRAGAERMAGMLDGLLGLARLARVELRSEPVDLSAVALAVAEQLEAADPARAARFEIAPSVIATGDPRLLRTVLANLLDNAWKFTEREPLAVIEVGVRQIDGEDRVFVADNGVGFDMTHAERLFTPFQRLHPDREFRGAGIGLATARRIVHSHGGRMWAEGVAGEGATFSFTLPGLDRSRGPDA
jgi:light-regulated signal transduction histidine kinase (bacteriophytochrome)